MRKIVLFLFLAISLLCQLTAQESASNTEEVNEQYELFSWEPVAKAKQYGVTVEKYDASTNTWSEYKTVKTTETQIEILFTPGTFRVSIATYNLIGRKGKSSEWVTFKILEENIPYLNERFLPKSQEWNAPVLFINHDSSNNIADDALPGGYDAANYITAPEGFGENSILIKGRNIFSPKTEFYLVPKDENSEGGREFLNYCDDRKEQQLQVLQRNSKEYSVVVSYDSQKLSSGYYALEVRNPGDNRDSIELLVLDDAANQITPEKGFEVDEHYNVNFFAEKNFGKYEFSIKGKGFNTYTEFYLEPAKGTFAYPFETELVRDNVELEITGIYKQGGGNAQITMTCEIEKLRTGYYNLIAKSWNGASAKFICLVKKPFVNDYTGRVKKLKTKYNKKSEYVDVTIIDSKFDYSKTYTLVSEYDSTIDSNKRVRLSLSPSGRKLTGTLTPDELTIAKYALIIEDEASYDVVYCDIDNRLKLSQNKMSDSVVSKTFLRPVGSGAPITLDVDSVGSVVYFDNELEMKKRMPPLFSNFKFDLTFLKDMTTVVGVELDLVNFGFVSLSTGYEYRTVTFESEHAAFATLRLAIPNNYFQPYLGAGIGQNIIIPQAGIKDFDSVLGMFKDKDQTYVYAQAGVVLFTVIDVRYNLILNNVFNSRYFTESVSFGFSFPLRSYKFKRKVLTQSAQITKPGVLEGATLIEPERKIPVDEIEIYKSSSVGGFANFNSLETVMLDPGVQTIEENAFADCKNLTEVKFATNLKDDTPLTIKTNAFAGDTKIESIRLPARTAVVQPGAFAGWTSGQIIVLDWLPDDTTERDLSGLADCSATVLYLNDEVFHGAYNTPLEDARNWCPINELVMRNVSVLVDDTLVLGVRLKGTAPDWYRRELDTWINQESPRELIDYIQTGDRIKFKVQGDGNSYNFILTTEGGGYFYYRFKTAEDELTEVEIPYKKLKKYSYSSQKKLDVDSIKMCCILPMCKGEWNEATFFDFEVTDNEKKKN